MGHAALPPRRRRWTRVAVFWSIPGAYLNNSSRAVRFVDFARWLLEPAQQDRLASASGTLGLNGGKPDRLIADLPQELVAAPGWASWRMAGPVLADAYWWSLQPQVPADAAADILKELDATVAELLSK